MLRRDSKSRRKIYKLSKTLYDPSTMLSAYNSILNAFVNNKKNSDFDKKVEIFDLNFVSQCVPINNSSVLTPFKVVLLVLF